MRHAWVFGSLLFVACDSSSPSSAALAPSSPVFDAGNPGNPTVVPPAPVDAGVEAGADAGLEAGVDAGAAFAGIVKVVAGGYHTCALHSSGSVWCWGDNQAGQLGLGTMDADPHPTAQRVTVIDRASDLSLSRYGTCALDAAGVARCWGVNTYRQLGADNGDDATCTIFGTPTACRLTPVTAPIATPITKIAAGYRHTCALVGDGLQCWGRNESGEAGHTGGDATCGAEKAACNATPQAVALGANVVDVVAGYDGTAALLQNGEVWMWGENSHGELATKADMEPHPIPARVADVTATQLGSTAGATIHLCVRKPGDDLACWGYNTFGETGATPPATTLNAVAGPFVEVGNGNAHTCARTAGGHVSCFGDNSLGQSARPDVSFGAGSPTPVEVPGLADATSLAIGAFHSCVLRADGRVSCWGRDASGTSGRVAADGLPPNQLVDVKGLDE